MNILLIEDDRNFGKLLTKWLQKLGVTVTWVVGLKSVDGSTALCMSAKGRVQTLTVHGKSIETWIWHPQDVAIDLSKFDFAFVDGQPEKGSLSGVEIVEQISKLVACVGVSTFSTKNDEMKAKQAVFGLTKIEFLIVTAGNFVPQPLDFRNPAVQNDLLKFAHDNAHNEELMDKLQKALAA